MRCKLAAFTEGNLFTFFTVQSNEEKNELCNYSAQDNFVSTVNSLETKAHIK